MRQITEKDGLQKEWYETAKNMTLEELPAFLKELTEDYEHDYGTICHAIASAAIAAAWAIERTPQGGITGFQASAVMWEFITNWMTEYKDKPVRLQTYENMLYPQYEDKFNTISQETADWLQKKAKEELAKFPKEASNNVRQHMQKIAGGHIPFGYSIGES